MGQVGELYKNWGAVHHAHSTVAQYLWAFGLWASVHDGKAIRQISFDDVEAFIQCALTSGLKAVSVNRALIALHVVISRAIRQHWYDGPNPFTRDHLLKEDLRHVVWLNSEQTRAVLRVAELHGRDAHMVFALGLLAGLRHGEIVAAQWSWVDFNNGLIHITQGDTFRTKSGRDRTIPLNCTLRAILSVYREVAGYIIAPDHHGKWFRYRTDFRKTFARVASEAGVSWLTPHALRHSFASQLVSAGVSVFKVSQWLGHRDINTTLVYAHLKPRDEDIDRI